MQQEHIRWRKFNYLFYRPDWRYFSEKLYKNTCFFQVVFSLELASCLNWHSSLTYVFLFFFKPIWMVCLYVYMIYKFRSVMFYDVWQMFKLLYMFTLWWFPEKIWLYLSFVCFLIFQFSLCMSCLKNNVKEISLSN